MIRQVAHDHNAPRSSGTRAVAVRRPRSVGAAQATARRPPQRERLLGAMAWLLAREGYANVTVARVIARAGVSRPTFYEHFADREGCFLAVLASAQRQLHRAVRAAVEGAPPERRAASVLEALVDFARSHPAIARVAFSESLSAGRRALEARDEATAELALIIEDGYAPALAPADAPAPDLPSSVLVGAVSRMLASRLSAGEPIAAELSRELHAWLASYELPLAEHRWRDVRPREPPQRSPFLPAGPLRCAPPRPAGARRVPAAHAMRAQRLPVIFATAELVSREGYDAITVAEIARRAAMESAAFYRLFAGKREALLACGELLFEHLMSVSAAAFVTGERWPERVWEAARACAQCLQQNPILAQAVVVESHAVGACTLVELERFTGAFTIFLEEGLRDEAASRRPSPVGLQALAASAFELGYQVMRRGDGERLSGLLGHIVFIALAPFLTAEQANLVLARLAPAGAAGLARLGEMRVDQIVCGLTAGERRQAQVHEVCEQPRGHGLRARPDLQVDDLEDRDDDRFEREP